MTNKVKLYRNPERNKPDNMRVHTPFYMQEGIEPQPYTSPTSPTYHSGSVRKAPLSTDNPRAPRPVLRQDYGDTTPSPIGRGRGSLPNVGNNVEQTWAGVDGEIVDDISEVDPNASMIDNNEFVSTEALGLPPDDKNMETEYATHATKEISEDSSQSVIKDEYLSVVLQQLEEDEFLLLVTGECIASGPLEEIQEQARTMVFGEHPLCDGNPIPLDDIVVIKRVPIKVGLFLS